jgi:hypothetical protein
MFDWEGDIAIDDIKLAPGLCGKNYWMECDIAIDDIKLCPVLW